MDIRIVELLELAREEGIDLPYTPETICAMEDVGCVVDLDTGAIIIGEADRPCDWVLTQAGRDVLGGAA